MQHLRTTQRFRTRAGLLILGLILSWAGQTETLAGDPANEIGSADSSPPTLKLGIYPYTFISRIVPTWQPLAAYLQQRLQRPVIIVSTKDNETFTRRAEHGDYFLYISAPHVAAMLDQRSVARRIAKVAVPIYAQLLAPKTAGYNGIEDLAGKTIATASDGTLVAELLDYRTARVRDLQQFVVTITNKPSHVSAVRAVLNGSADAAYVVPLPYKQVIGSEIETLVVLERSKLTTNSMLLSPAGLGIEHASKMARLVNDFQSTDKNAATMFAPYLYSGPAIFQPIEDSDINNLMPLVNHWQSKSN